jgi:hypothetical protein
MAPPHQAGPPLAYALQEDGGGWTKAVDAICFRGLEGRPCLTATERRGLGDAPRCVLVPVRFGKAVALGDGMGDACASACQELNAALLRSGIKCVTPATARARCCLLAALEGWATGPVQHAPAPTPRPPIHHPTPTPAPIPTNPINCVPRPFPPQVCRGRRRPLHAGRQVPRARWGPQCVVGAWCI